MKPGLRPLIVFVTGTTCFGWVIEFESSGSAASVMAVPYEVSEVAPLISTSNATTFVAGFTSLTKISPVRRSRVAQP